MKYSFINSARGIAILMVIIVHISQLYHFKNSNIKLLFDYCQMGVQLFFIASAYTLCLSAEKRKDEYFQISNFYIRRFFRIFPIYYFGIIVYFFLNYYLKDIHNYTFRNLFANITFIHGIIPSANNTIVPGGWSIGTEMLFYLMFPFVHKFILSNFLILKTMLLISGFYLIIIAVQSNMTNNSFAYFNIIVQMPVFITGILYYKYEKKLSLLSAIMLFCVFTFISLYLWRIDMFLFVPFISGISFCGLIKILEKTIFDLKLLQKLGVVSYSLYITHFILAFYIFKPTENIVLFAIYILMTIFICYPFALFLEKYLELPFIRMGNRIINYRRLLAKKNYR